MNREEAKEISNIITKFMFSFNFFFFISPRDFFISLHLSLLFFHPIPPIYPAKKSQYTSFIVSDAIIANESGEITVIKIDFFRPHFLLPSFLLSHNTQKLLACCLQPLLLFTLFKWHRSRKKIIFIALKMIFAIKLHSKK